ncbi:MAG TPA: glycosyltransferase family 2 protein [Saprospiraceae bacterium]|nr:glycosyltransferase family 2 protein [Saprospiraceae bacterium]MCB9268130.1 glycosyltransferase family 2 protein [Lewinellaceae bacterium]HPG08321.1 glycosyltransferase family 2 protein [Saprospiraceae bacterium]HPR01571.1 glycosyltransferase family 2 protein [Saprospiraceae bacterium]HRV85576.1 glycosyltransferase family 2 protein [Saprospiraceae bacterium]
MDHPAISLVIPLLNEAESLPELEAWIRKVAESHELTYEIIFVDDGSTDGSWEVIQGLARNNPAVKAIRFRRNYGKSAALNTAFQATKGDVVITMDADLQDSPDEIPELYRMITQDGWDLVSGWKKKRYDPLSKTIPTKLYNAVVRRMSGLKLHDFNCGLKAYRNEVVKSIEVYGEMHRYIPVMAKWAGFKKIGEKVVQHQARKYGTSKFGLSRFINGPLDLISIIFVSRFGKRPMHLFGMLGFLFFIIGFCILLYLSISKIFWDTTHIADRPLFYLGILVLIVGSQLFLTGFLAELVTRNAPQRNVYLVAEKLRISNEMES